MHSLLLKYKGFNKNIIHFYYVQSKNVHFFTYLHFQVFLLTDRFSLAQEQIGPHSMISLSETVLIT